MRLQTPRKTYPAVIAVFVAFLAVGMAGCGGGGGGNSPPPAPLPSPPPPPSPPPSPPPPPSLGAGLEWKAALVAMGEEVIARGVAPGPDGSFYVTGSFGAGTPMWIGSLSAMSAGRDDIFLARINASGQPMWLRTFGGSDGDTAFDVDSDSAGNAYVAGIATGQISFGAHSINAGDGDAVIFKVSADGTVAWVRGGAGSGISAGNEVATRPDGVSIIVGPYSGATDFGGGTTLPPTPSGRDIFAAAFSTGGTPLWARALQGPDPGSSTTEAARGVGVDPTGRVLMTGPFRGRLDVSTGAGTVQLNSQGANADCFIVAYSPAGNLEYARRFGGAGTDVCRGVGGDAFGSVRVAGRFDGSIFDPPNSLVSAGQEDLFVASFDKSGTVEFARRVGGPNSEEGAELEVFSDSDAFVFGDYANGATLPNNTSLTSAGSRDLLLMRIGPTGDLTAWLVAGGAGNDTAFALAVQPSSAVAVVGTFTAGSSGPAEITFGSTTLVAGTHSQASFIALAGPGTASPPPPPPTSSNLNIVAAAEYARNTNGRALVVWRDGQLIFEQYANGGSATRSELLASGSKSFSCALAASAMQDGILDVDSLASVRITPWGPGGAAPNNSFKQLIRLRDLLDLSSGLSGSGAAGGGLYAIDSYAQAINDPSRYAPDTHLVYTPNHFQAFLAYFELATGGIAQPDGGVTGGRDPGEYFQTTVLDRIGAHIAGWRRDADSNPILAGGANMTALDWARYGQFVLQRGQWNGQQVLPQSSMDACRTPQSPLASNIYGRGFWLNVPALNFNPAEDSVPIDPTQEQRLAAGGNFIPTAPTDLFFAWGAGNMKLFIIPSRNLVIARMAGATDDVEFFRLLFS